MQHTKTCLVTYLPTNNYGVLYSHCFNITGWHKYAHQRIKFSTVVKLYYAYLFTHQIWAFYLNYFLTYEGVPKIQDCVAVVHMRHLAEKVFNFGKAPMHVYLYTIFQLPNLINSRDMRGPTLSLESAPFVASSTSFWYQFFHCRLARHFFLFWLTILYIHNSISLSLPA